MTNSVVPIAKAASANARIGSGSREVGTDKVTVVFVRRPYASLPDGAELLQQCQVVLECQFSAMRPLAMR